jgi:hypothetical protein
MRRESNRRLVGGLKLLVMHCGREMDRVEGPNRECHGLSGALQHRREDVHELQPGKYCLEEFQAAIIVTLFELPASDEGGGTCGDIQFP